MSKSRAIAAALLLGAAFHGGPALAKPRAGARGAHHDAGAAVVTFWDVPRVQTGLSTLEKDFVHYLLPVAAQAAKTDAGKAALASKPKPFQIPVVQTHLRRMRKSN